MKDQTFKIYFTEAINNRCNVQALLKYSPDFVSSVYAKYFSNYPVANIDLATGRVAMTISLAQSIAYYIHDNLDSVTKTRFVIQNPQEPVLPFNTGLRTSPRVIPFLNVLGIEKTEMETVVLDLSIPKNADPAPWKFVTELVNQITYQRKTSLINLVRN